MYVVSYDISSNKLRNKIFKTQYDALYKELMSLMQGQPEGNIRIYDLCEMCSKNIRVIGVPDGPKEEDEDIVVI